MSNNAKAAQTGAQERITTAAAKRAKSPTEQKGDKTPFYSEFSDGNGIVHRIANMENPLVCRRSGKIQIESLMRTKYKQPNAMIRAVYDPRMRLWFGVPLGIDPNNKRIRWQTFMLGDWREYDLRVFDQAVEWAVVSRANFMEGSPYQSGKPRYRKIDVEADAQKNINRITLASEAVGIAQKTKINQWVNIARRFQRNPEGMSTLSLQEYVLEVAHRSPEEFLDYWNGQNRDVVDIFNSAESTGLISHDRIEGWRYKGVTPLGVTRQQALEYLIKNVEFTASVQDEARTRDVAVTAVAQASREISGHLEEDDERVNDLRIKAQLLGIRGVDVMTEEMLTKRVEEAEKMVTIEDDFE